MRTGGADQYVDTLFQHGQLLVVPFATVGEAELEAGRGGHALRIVVDLDRQPGRGHDDGARLVDEARLGQRMGQQIVEGGGQEGKGFAGPCLGLTGEVMTFYQQWQRQCLDGVQ